MPKCFNTDGSRYGVGTLAISGGQVQRRRPPLHGLQPFARFSCLPAAFECVVFRSVGALRSGPVVDEAAGMGRLYCAGRFAPTGFALNPALDIPLWPNPFPCLLRASRVSRWRGASRATDAPGRALY